MAVTHKDSMTLVAGEAMSVYRRVKYHSSAGQVVYADAADGDGWIGVTMPGPDGGGVAMGDPVTIELRGENKTLKVECSTTVTANASLYPENDGKVSDDAGTVVIGTAAGTDTGAASTIIEMHPNGGSGSVTTDSTIAGLSGTTLGAVPIIYRKVVTATTTAAVANPGRAIRIVDVHAVHIGNTATQVKLLNGATEIVAAASLALAGTTGVLTRATAYNATNIASLSVTASGTVYAALATADATGVEVIITAVPT